MTPILVCTSINNNIHNHNGIFHESKLLENKYANVQHFKFNPLIMSQKPTRYSNCTWKTNYSYINKKDNVQKQSQIKNSV